MPERIPRSLFAALCFAAALLAENSYAANAPTNLRVASSQSTPPATPPDPLNSGRSIYDLAWDDNSDDEDSFLIHIGTSPGSTIVTIPTSRNSNYTTVFLNDGAGNNLAGLTLYFSIQAISSTSGNSALSNEDSVDAPAVGLNVTNVPYNPATRGVPMTPFVPDTAGTANSFNVTDLPDGLTFDPATGEISGTPAVAGLFRPEITITNGFDFAGTFLTLRIIENPGAPALTAPIPDYQFFSTADPVQWNLNAHFSDPDTSSAVRIATNRGPIDAIIYDEVTPATADNFYTYLNRGDYTDVVFHRSVSSTPGAPNFAGVDVIQAGWFKPDGSGDYIFIATDPVVINEPGISNLRGTIAMAKKSGNANSATSQWYFNVTDSTVLDPVTQNGGFTVFGRATTPSLAKMDEIHALPFADYSVTIDGLAKTITDWPTNQVPAGSVPAPADLVQILSVTPITSLITYNVTGNTAPAVATATVVGSTLEIAPASLTASGETTVTVTATDLDGNVTMDSFVVTVPNDYNIWTHVRTFPGGLSGPLDDGERDTLNNTLEYAFEGDINHADSGPVSPDLSTADVPGGSDHLAITFTHLKFADDLNYEVQRNTGTGGWITVWKTADGFAHPNVFDAVDGVSSSRLTIIDPDPVTARPASVLRVAVALLPTGS